ncbi:MAG TPA: zf-HC2 domain-containing protein [Dictyobacter sp.]|jgi:hypothetical protein|nr:zf-HC2 domain-containing protein [Dictyobacter sp.]
MSCEQVKDLLSAYLDNQLAAGERQSIALHLQLCNSCRDILSDYRYFDDLLAQLPRITPQPALRSELFLSLEEYLTVTGTSNNYNVTRHYADSTTSSIRDWHNFQTRTIADSHSSIDVLAFFSRPIHLLQALTTLFLVLLAFNIGFLSATLFRTKRNKQY